MFKLYNMKTRKLKRGVNFRVFKSDDISIDSREVIMAVVAIEGLTVRLHLKTCFHETDEFAYFPCTHKVCALCLPKLPTQLCPVCDTSWYVAK